MKPRTRSSVPLLVLVAVAGLVLGSFGTATAGGLTKGKVKTIAAKVVKKSAPTLSVSHAATANNATTLKGEPAGQYKNPGYRFALAAQAAATERTYSFAGVPAGTYLVGYNVFVDLSEGASEIVCTLRANATTPLEVISGSATYGAGNATSGAVAMLQLTGAPPELDCSAPGGKFAVSNAGGSVSKVTFTRVDGIADATVSARVSGDSGPHLRRH